MTSQAPGIAGGREPSSGLNLVHVAGEVARRAQARELGAGVVTALFRLVKLSTLHASDNQAVVRQIEDTVTAVTEYGRRTEHNVSVLFAHGSVFIGGQLLRANRGVYEGALELGDILAKVGAAEIGIQKDVKAQDFYAFVAAMAEALRSPKPPKVERPSPRIRLRGLSASALGREIAVEKADSKEEPRAAIARTYASAIVIMRRFFEALRRGRYELPQRIKRVAQRLVDLSAGDTPAFLGVTTVRNQNHDEAGRAVNSAILALSMTRQVSEDPVQLLRVAMAALLLDVGRARVAGVVGDAELAFMPNLSDAQEDELPAGTAVVLTALGRVNEPSVMRTVMGYEAHWVRREASLGSLYRGLRPASLQARIIATARAFNDKLTPAAGGTALPADEAIAQLEQAASDNADRTALRLLIGALGLFPTGTLVELSTGEVAIVVETPESPALYSQPQVRIVLDATGGSLARPVAIDLSQRPGRGEPARYIRRVVATSDDPSAAALRAFAGNTPEQPAPAPTDRPRVGASGSGVRSPGVGASGVQSSPISSPWTPTPTSQRHPSIPTMASQFTRPASAPPGSSSPISIRDREEVDEGAFAEDGPLDNATRAMTSDDRARLLGARIVEEPPPNARRSVIPDSAELRARPTARPVAVADRAPAPPVPPIIVPPPTAAPPEPEVAPAKKATAEGALGKTPLVHLLVYMLDQRLTGTTVFQAPDGMKHAVVFEDGAPAKIRTGGQVAPLDRVILEEGLLDEATLKETLLEVSRKKTLHGRHLVLQGLLERETVIEVLRVQLIRKMQFLFELPKETRYAYYEGENLLANYGGPELTPVEPLSIIMGGVRLRAQDAVVDATLARVVGRPLALHKDAEVRRFGLQRDEMAVTDVLRGKRMTMAELAEGGVGQPRVVKMMVYALAITRSLDLGAAGRPPVGIGRAVVDPPFARLRAAETAAKAKVEQDRAAQAAPGLGGDRQATPGRTGFGMGFGKPQTKAEVQTRPRSDGRAAAREAEARSVDAPGSARTPPSPITPRSQEMPPLQERASEPPVPPRLSPLPEAPPSGRPTPLVSSMPPVAPTTLPAPPLAPARASTPPAGRASTTTQPRAGRTSTPAPASGGSTARRIEIAQRSASIDGEDHFTRLGLPHDASDAMIQATYFGLAKTWHPDRVPADLDDVRPEVARIFSKLSESFQVLSDAKKRADYKRLVDQGGGVGPSEEEKVAKVVDAAMSFQKAEVLFKKNDLPAAEQLAAAAVRGDPEQPEYVVLHVFIQAQRRGDPPPLAEGKESTHFDDLIRTLDVILTREPRFERALYTRGALLKRSGRTERAIRDFRLAAEVNPKNIDAVREVRLYEMRKRGGKPAPGPAPEGGGGILGKFWKR